jgi:hypothetical protein
MSEFNICEFNICDTVSHIERPRWRGVVEERYACGDCRVYWDVNTGYKRFFLVHESKNLVLIEHGWMSDFEERIKERLG